MAESLESVGEDSAASPAQPRAPAPTRAPAPKSAPAPLALTLPIPARSAVRDVLAPLLGGDAPGDLAGLDDAAAIQLVDAAALASDHTAIAAALMATSVLIPLTPNDPTPQINALELLDTALPGADLAASWAALQNRFPTSETVLRRRMRALGRDGRMAEGAEAIRRHLAGLTDGSADAPQSVAHTLLEAELFAELGDTLSASLRYESLIERCPGAAKPALSYAVHLAKSGALWDAGRVLATITEADALTDADWQTCEEIAAALANGGAGSKAGPTMGADQNLAAFARALGQFAGRSLPEASGALGRVAILADLTGEGAADAGALLWARGLQEVYASKRTVAGRRVSGGPKVYFCDPHDPPDALPELSVEISRDRLSDMTVDDGLPVPKTLPPLTRLGLPRLARAFAESPPDALIFRSLEGLLIGALPALEAGVPSLLFRLPPGLDPSPAVVEAISAFAALPGCRLALPDGGTRAAGWPPDARDLSAAPILAEPAEPLPAAGSAPCRATWERFARQSDASGMTIGTVLHPQRRESETAWVELCQGLEAAGQRHRHILLCPPDRVQSLRAAASEAGLSAPNLIIAAGTETGFWLKRMDVAVFFLARDGVPMHLRAAQLSGRAALVLALDQVAPRVVDAVDVIPPTGGGANIPVALDWLELQRTNPALRQTLARRGQRSAIQLCSTGAAVEGLIAALGGAGGERPGAR